MASATCLSAPVSPLQSRQMSGAASSCSGSFLGDPCALRHGAIRPSTRGSQRGLAAPVISQHRQAMYESRAEVLPPSLWVQDSMLAAVDAASAAQAARVVDSAKLPVSSWTQTPEPSVQAARCSWPKQSKAAQGPLMFAEDESHMSEGQQLHEEFAEVVMKRSKSEQLLLELEKEASPLAPHSAWPRVSKRTESIEQFLGPRSAWPRASLQVATEERVLGPRCAYPRIMEAAVPAVPLVEVGAACAWPRQSQPALVAAAPDAERMFARCEWPRKEAPSEAVGPVEGARCAWPPAKTSLRSETTKVVAPRKVIKKETQGWPWRVAPVGLEPVPDAELAEGPRCAWPRVQPQGAHDKLARSHASSPPAGPRCEWPAKQGVSSISPAAIPSPALGPRCALKLDHPPQALPVLGAACAWPKQDRAQTVSQEEDVPVLGPRCPIKLPEMGPRCPLKPPPEPVLGPRCALKLPVAEETVKVEGPRCAWPKPGSELALKQAVEEKENVAPAKAQKRAFPRRALFTRIPVRNAKKVSAGRVGKVKVAQPQQPEVGQEAAKPLEKVAVGGAWPRRLLATSLGLGVVNQALLKSKAEAATLNVPAVMWRRLESYSSARLDSAEDTSS